jgi:uncharacterized protein (TIGR02271 family)
MSDTNHDDMHHDNDARTERVIPVVQEELVTDTRAVKTGSVRVQKHVEKSVYDVELPLLSENVDVKHVPVNRVVKEAPAIHRSGDTIIVPVVEEELVVTKRLVLKEEIHIVKRRTRERATREVALERERAEVQRLDAQGRVVQSSSAGSQAKATRKPLIRAR